MFNRNITSSYIDTTAERDSETLERSGDVRIKVPRPIQEGNTATLLILTNFQTLHLQRYHRLPLWHHGPLFTMAVEPFLGTRAQKAFILTSTFSSHYA